MTKAMNRLSAQICAALTDQLKGGKARPPEAGRLLWNAFTAISATRTYHMAGPNPLQPSEIEAWCRISHQPLEPRHVEILLAMDRAWLAHAFSRSKAPEGMKTLPPVSRQPISAALMDVVFG